ncbi:hypothetical protein CAPTEDRAFT_181567 [Capitella teleta]|uniref:UPAR/Ly6 domain-containing protein qvr n=1 Tax=Capitella teleta TaxID=283909 RepID=R7UQC9_CAPTE|nr:hypothetical protein CAPTEDRAFT_181567 [Capitella teleta]|eukprot:ELU06132.1 hypothetical protein CAPTEDRAFT_181567 [Capitella teleta]
MELNWANCVLCITALISLFKYGEAIQCYQCDSNEDQSCPSERPFDRNLNALVDCNSFEARTPGTFCMKITQQSPGCEFTFGLSMIVISYLTGQGWKKVTRRCGSRSDTGVAWGCRWEYEENGVWKEVCYCEDRDGCNAASNMSISLGLLLVLPLLFKCFL